MQSFLCFTQKGASGVSNYYLLFNFRCRLGKHQLPILGINFECPGTTGHGSLLHKDTAGEKVRHIIDKAMDFRQTQVEKLENNPEFTIGDVTSVNLTILKGGVQVNVVPPLIMAAFDIRLALDVDHSEFEAMVFIGIHRKCR